MSVDDRRPKEELAGTPALETKSSGVKRTTARLMALQARFLSGTKGAEKKPETWADTFKTLGYALLIALVIRSFFFQPFNIPSESMKPTLLVGDYLFVSKFSYGYSRHSLPLSLPLIPGRIISGAPERGDVVVFKTPSDNRTDYIKRVVGLPGDELQMISGVLHINGTAVQRRRIGDYEGLEHRTGGPQRGTLYEETLPNGVTYTTLDLGPRAADDTRVFRVPAGHYFMMGDNRDNSTDSRFPASRAQGGVGYVPAENLVGRAEVIFFSTDGSAALWQFWGWFSAARYGRFFTTID